MQHLKIALAGNSAWSILNFREDLIKRLIANGHKVFVIAPIDSAHEKLRQLGCEHEDINISRKGVNPFKDIFLIIKYRILISKHSFDYVLTFNPKPNLYNCFASFFSNSRIIVNISGLGSGFINNNLLTKLLIIMYRIAFKKAYKIFFQNVSDKEIFEDLGILKNKSSALLPGSGINLELFPKNNNHLLTVNKIYFTFVGRLIKDKGLIEFIEAAQSCVRQNTNLFFNICGDIDPGNPSSVDKEFIRRSLSKNIFFMGHVEDIKGVLEESHCIVLPSYREGLSRSLLEGAAIGIPIITTNVPGCRELVDENKKNGYLCRVKDAYDLEKKILKFSSLDPQAIFELGNNSRKKAEQDFSVEKVINSYLESINS